MSGMSFETALNSRVDQMLDACIKCGKCVDICPSVQPAGIANTSPQAVIAGVLDIVRAGDGPEASRKWAASWLAWMNSVWQRTPSWSSGAITAGSLASTTAGVSKRSMRSTPKYHS